MNSNATWIVGAGGMGRQHSRVLTHLGEKYGVICRDLASASSFESESQVAAVPGGVAAALEELSPPERAIVAADMPNLFEVSSELLNAGVNRLLVEKPGGMSPHEIASLKQLADDKGSQVYIAFNRRFYASVKLLRRLVDEDGGVRSFNFEFTEWGHLLSKSPIDKAVKNVWFWGNSLHVVDLAFHLGGAPEKMSPYHAGGVDWHPSASIFSGSGQTSTGALFSYSANWASPGRWWVEMLTDHRRYLLKPLEELKVQEIGELEYSTVELPGSDDLDFMPGVLKQMEAFLAEDDNAPLCRLDDFCALIPSYSSMVPYWD